MLENDRPGWTDGIAQAIAFTDNRINQRFVALPSLTKFDGIIGTHRETSATPHALVFHHLTHGTGDRDDIVCQQGQYPAGGAVSLIDGLGDMLGIVGHAAKINAV